jgi:hypothetical protein
VGTDRGGATALKHRQQLAIGGDLGAGRGVVDLHERDAGDVVVGAGPNGLDTNARNQMVGWTGTGALNGWVRHDHPAKKGYKPLEVFER